MATVRERFTPQVIGVDSSVKVLSNSIGGFLAKTAGTISVVRNNEDGTTTTLIDAVAVTAGVFTPMPFYIGELGATVTTAGGASGTLGV